MENISIIPPTRLEPPETILQKDVRLTAGAEYGVGNPS
jgi:hypothetical protein